MSHLYVDSSIIVSILFRERAASTYQRALERAERLFSSQLIEAEVLSASKREKIPVELAINFLAPISMVIPDRSLSSEFQKVFSKGYCKGADAFHLATALYLAPSPEDLVFLTADRAQGKLARSLGFPLKL